MKKISAFLLSLCILIASFCLFTGCANGDRREVTYSGLCISLKEYADKIAKAEEEKAYWEEKVDEAEKDLEESEAELEDGYLYWEYEFLKGNK